MGCKWQVQTSTSPFSNSHSEHGMTRVISSGLPKCFQKVWLIMGNFKTPGTTLFYLWSVSSKLTSKILQRSNFPSLVRGAERANQSVTLKFDRWPGYFLNIFCCCSLLSYPYWAFSTCLHQKSTSWVKNFVIKLLQAMRIIGLPRTTMLSIWYLPLSPMIEGKRSIESSATACRSSGDISY